MGTTRRTPPPQDIMNTTIYDPGNTGRVDNSSNVSDGINTSTASEVRNSIDRNIVLSGVGNPNGVITGYVGQTYKDLTNGKFYKCLTDATTNWILI